MSLIRKHVAVLQALVWDTVYTSEVWPTVH